MAKVVSSSTTIRVLASPPPVQTPTWLAGVSINQWKEIPNSKMEGLPAVMLAGSGTPPGADGNYSRASGRMDAWNGFAAKGTDIYSVRQGGHGDYFGNEVIRFNLGSNTPQWTIIKPSFNDVSKVTPSTGYYAAGIPASTHGYYSNRVVTRSQNVNRNWIVSIGSTAVAWSGGTTTDCVVYDIDSNTYLPAGTFPNTPNTILAEYGVIDDPASGDIFRVAAYQVSQWKQSTNQWTNNVLELPNQYGYPCVCATDTTRGRAIILAGDPAKRSPYLLTFAKGANPLRAQEMLPRGEPGPNNCWGHYGLTFCPVTDKFYALLHNDTGFPGLYEIDANFQVNPSLDPNKPVINVVRSAVPGTSNIPDAGHGVFARFHYIHELGGIVYFPAYAANAWFLRLF